ncbi:hypothetical protein L3X38_038572 [Prunus dulcis]|uniref:Uncharacterized protein n=1 Tax=Prunus dulcis TaxID=3755 RepID=A0AAD4YRR4_PRUDU|nr:hypothetical protein L3X38_038572 [Prunus dulcis]
MSQLASSDVFETLSLDMKSDSSWIFGVYVGGSMKTHNNVNVPNASNRMRWTCTNLAMDWDAIDWTRWGLKGCVKLGAMALWLSGVELLH